MLNHPTLSFREDAVSEDKDGGRITAAYRERDFVEAVFLRCLRHVGMDNRYPITKLSYSAVDVVWFLRDTDDDRRPYPSLDSGWSN